MSNSNLIMTLGKVIIAAAWVDGEVSNDEVNSLKDLLFHLPGLNARQWAELDIYIDHPVDDAERARLVAELQAAIGGGGDKEFAKQALHEMVAADGIINRDEQRIVDEISRAIDDADTGLIGSLSRLVKGPVQRRSDAVRQAPNREKYIGDYLNNRVYYGVRRRLDLEDRDLDLRDDELRKLSMAGGLMGQVARVNNEVTDEELQAIVTALKNGWGLAEAQAAFVAAIAVEDSANQFDAYRLAREFVAVCAHDELVAFLDVLFDIALSDGFVHNEEIEEIRMIARSLLLTHEEFINAKLKVPREKREA